MIEHLPANMTGYAHNGLDTKYKTPEQPASEDIEQVVAYAAAKACERAALAYPTTLHRRIAGRWGDIYVESLAFRLNGDIEECGREFLAQLLPKPTNNGSMRTQA